MANNNSSGKKSTYIYGLDSIRFFLALIVLLSHLKNPWAFTLKASEYFHLKFLGSLFPNLFSGIGAGIGFFIVSGFVIHYPIKYELKNVMRFLLRRWIRIGIPLLIISIIDIMSNNSYVIPIWSLYCELIYYTLYPLLYRMRISWTKKFWGSFIIALLIIIFFAKGDIKSLLYQKDLNFKGAYWQFGDYITWIIGLPCWLLGVVIAEKIDSTSRKISRFKIYTIRSIVLCISIILSIVRFHLFFSYILSMNLFAFILYYWLFSEILYFKNHKAPIIFEKMGLFSYSIYLCHSLFVIFLEHYLPFNNQTYILFIVLTIALSYIFYIVVEKPSHQLARKLANYIKYKPYFKI